ncbi:MAG: hypothetical protein EOO38_05640 [Cytophagaceae bacterium]|jgi:hypothetical protein|nr:MAG: hypothetical protein EOO38_05640 [Cytophagaceae bacterium]
MRLLHLLPACFFAAGLITRLILRETETRWQIVGFAFLTLLLWLTMRRVSSWFILLTGIAACAGVLIAKFSIEGLYFKP